MLMSGGRIAEPRIVRHVDEQRRLLQHCELLRRVRVFVADRHAELLTRRIERGLRVAARLEAAVRQLHALQPVAHELRHGKVFAQRHEPALRVPLRLVAERQHRVVVDLAPRSRGAAARAPASSRCASPASHCGPRKPPSMCTGAASADSGQTMMSAPRCGCVRSRYSSSVASNCAWSHFISCGTAPCTMRDGDRLARRLRPFATPQREADESRLATTALAAAMRARELPNSNATTAPARQRDGKVTPYTPTSGARPASGVSSLRVAEREPREAAEEPAAKPFEHGDGGRQHDAASAARRALLDPARRARSRPQPCTRP